jgi:hypothetical protein
VKKNDDLFELGDDNGFRFGVAGAGVILSGCISHVTIGRRVVLEEKLRRGRW